MLLPILAFWADGQVGGKVSKLAKNNGDRVIGAYKSGALETQFPDILVPKQDKKEVSKRLLNNRLLSK